MKKKIQVLCIGGGMTFKSRDDYLDWLKTRSIKLDFKNSWHGDYLKNGLGEDFQIVKPRMPLQDCAEYEDWKIWFERYLEEMDDNFILAGSSLGGIFLTKYLSENVVDKNIISVYLVCPPFDNDLIGEDLVGGFELGEDLSLIEKNCGRVVLMFSSDDDCVPISHAEKYRDKLGEVEIFVYDDKNGHFDVEEFPEIVGMIREDAKNMI
ncbi:hypothetical protein HN903_03375 [archaeon]|jgi:predicted alpha/beta hydrolase family esterase|nr:hypothetical protein [archaeon]MBT7128771.1 hypothetical protein [archaeon]